MNHYNVLSAFLSALKLIGFLTCERSLIYSICRVSTRKSEPTLLNGPFGARSPHTAFVSLLLIASIITILSLSGCGGGRVPEATQNTNSIDLNELEGLFELPDRLLGSPVTRDFFLNSLINEFGDIPQVRTYVALLQKLGNREHLSVDEIIALLAADLYLYPSENKANVVKTLEDAKEKVEAAGIDFPRTYEYSISIDITDGDTIEVHYPDGSKKASGVWKKKLPRTIRSLHRIKIDTQQDDATPEAKTEQNNLD